MGIKTLRGECMKTKKELVFNEQLKLYEKINKGPEDTRKISTSTHNRTILNCTKGMTNGCFAFYQPMDEHLKKDPGGAVVPALHTGAYYNEVNELLSTATTAEEVYEILTEIADMLQKGNFMK